MADEVLLAPGGRLKLLEFIVKAAIGSDRNHENFCAIIDVTKHVLTISCHIAVNSGIAATYMWPIRHTHLTKTVHLELPAKGLVKILNHFNLDKPIWLIIENERKLIWAEYVEKERLQPSLFDVGGLDIGYGESHGITYGMQVKNQCPVNQYQLPVFSPDASFQVAAGALSSALKLVHQLTQENNHHHTTRDLIFSLGQDPEHKPVLTVYANKGSWYSAQTIAIEPTMSPAPGALSGARVDIGHISHIAGVLSQVSGQVSVVITSTHLIFSKPHWQCSFTLIPPSWDGLSIMQPWQQISSEQCCVLDTLLLSQLLQKLNVANEEKKARLIFKRDQASDSLHLAVSQDHVSADIDLKSGVSLFPVSTAISLSLWGLSALLDYFGRQVYWYYQPDHRAVLITDLMRKEHILLYAKPE